MINLYDLFPVLPKLGSMWVCGYVGSFDCRFNLHCNIDINSSREYLKSVSNFFFIPDNKCIFIDAIKIFRRNHAPITTYDTFKNWLMREIFTFHCKILCPSYSDEKKWQISIFWKMIHILLSICPFYKIYVNK